jgi:hypothetical protein
MRHAALIFLCLLGACKANPPGSQKPSAISEAHVRQFGPLIDVEMNEESPNPETYRTALFTQNAEGRRGILRALGLGKIPEIDSTWQEFLKAHPEKSEDALLAAFASASVLDEPLEDHSRQVVLDLGFNEDSEHPFGIVSLFNQRNGSWQHIATFACACGLGYSTDPLDDLKHRAPVHDLVIGTSTGEPDVGRGYLLHETHFRMKEGILRPLIDFERMREQCPQNTLDGPACTVWDTRLEKEMLADKQGTTRPGFALVTMDGHPNPPSCKMCGLVLHNPTCTVYGWDEVQFRYVPTELSPVKCGEPLRNPTAKDMDAKSSRPTAK